MKLSSLSKLLLLLFFTPSILIFNTHAKILSESTLTQTYDLVKANNKYVTLLGTQVNIGDKAPNFKVVDKNFAPIQLTDLKGKTVLISVVPSLE